MSIGGVGPLAVDYQGDGVYHARWTPFVIGTFNVDITLAGTPIAGSPFQTQIRFF